MNKLLLLFTSLLFISCGTTLDKTDKAFEDCTQKKYDELNKILTADNLKQIKNQSIHQLFENELIAQKHLLKISKEAYIELLHKISREEIERDFTNKFDKKIGFSTLSLFAAHSQLSCYGYLLNELEIIDEQDWQYQFALAYNSYEAYGDMKIADKHLINALSKIPEGKFQYLTYRNLFLNLIYHHLDEKS